VNARSTRKTIVPVYCAGVVGAHADEYSGSLMLVWKAMLMPEEGIECEEEWSLPMELIEESVPEEPAWSLCLVKSAIVRTVCPGRSMLGFISLCIVFAGMY